MTNPLLLFLACSAVVAAERPNVVLICVDDLKPTIGCFHDPVAKTPNIDRLARHGVVFTRAYVQQALCSPSRNAMLTGLRPDQLGIYDLETNFRHCVPEAITLPQAFMQAGWQVEGMGKIFHRDDAASWSVPHVFLHGNMPIEHQGSPAMPASATPPERPAGWKERGAPWSWPDCDDSLTMDARIAAHAVQRIAGLSSADKPFFLAVGFAKPHLPFHVPKRWWDLYDPASLPVEPVDATIPIGAPPRAGNVHFGELRNYADIQGAGRLTPDQARVMVHGYYASTSFVDAQVGKVVEALESRNLMDRTIIVLWGDHGWHLGDHGWWTKHTNYEQATRHPVIICAPGFSQGTASASLIASIDLYPTLCAIAGVTAPAGLPGKDLSPILRDPAASVQDGVLSVYPRPIYGKSALGRALRTARWRYIEWRLIDETRALVAEELYDMDADPRETRSLARDPQHRELMDGFQARLTQLPPAKLPPAKPAPAMQPMEDR